RLILPLSFRALPLRAPIPQTPKKPLLPAPSHGLQVPLPLNFQALPLQVPALSAPESQTPGPFPSLAVHQGRCPVPPAANQRMCPCLQAPLARQHCPQPPFPVLFALSPILSFFS